MHFPDPKKWGGAISIDYDDVVRNKFGKPYALVHLADRNKDLFEKYKAKWAAGMAVSLPIK